MESKRFGGGGNGAVWRVSRQGDDAVFVLKVLGSRQLAEKERRDRFEDEIRFLREYPDDGVLPLIDGQIAVDEDVSWYVMPLATPLLVALETDPTIDVLETVAIYAETLARLAAQGIGHRDIKPDNLFMLDGRPVIGDFGLVTFPGKGNRTAPGRKLGPANFLAPEMLEHADTADFEPADVWSLAKTLWVLLAGLTYPLPGEYRSTDSNYSLRTWIGSPWIAELDLLMEQCTRLRPAERPSMAAVARELRACLSSPPEVRVDTDTTALRERVVSLTRQDRDKRQEVQLERQRFDDARHEIDLLNSAVYGHLLLETFNEHPGQPEPNDAAGLLPHEVMPRWQHSRGVLLTSPDPASRVWVRFSVHARKDFDGDDLGISAWLQVVHRHRGLEHFAFQWKDTYTAPLGTAQFRRVLEEIERAVQNSEASALREIGQILNLPDDHDPDWYPPDVPAT
ncbi:protein kinase domain-containing protein [Catenulispora rubra]|uniref:protein kinase domain-containing protein n=1 Tax=Catenulispora rubra TaxID=280293 RepID=UPI0018922D31|nr:protein kinase [Catenulispora rubra]